MATLAKSNAVVLEKKPISYQTLLLGAGNNINNKRNLRGKNH